MHELRKTLGIHRWAPLGAALLLLFLWAPAALADGTETLGPPGIPIASGSGFVASGVGLSHLGDGQPGTISIDVPGAVVQALLYWEGSNQGTADFTPTMDITVDGIDVTGTSIGGNTRYSGVDGSSNGFVTVCYRADITDLVESGLNDLEIDGLDFNQVNDGAGLLVTFDDGSTSAIEIRDGSDYAFTSDSGSGPLDLTVPQTFSFLPSTEDRTAALSLFFGAVAGEVSGAGDQRPSTIEITVEGVTTEVINLLNSVDGEEWDTVNLDVTIPTDATLLTVQAFSDDRLGTGNLPASMVWVAAGLSIEEEEGGGGEGCTPGYWKQRQHFGSYPMPPYPDTLFSDIFEDAFPGMTLVQVLAQGGGGLNALGRHTVAALLNGASVDVDYDLTDSDVIDMFNEVYPGEKEDYNDLKSVFSGFNEQMCPLGRADLEEDRLSRTKRVRRVRRR